MFIDVTAMQKHVRFHLERLALYALPDMDEATDHGLASERSSDSHQVIENRGRQVSVGNDFVEDREAFRVLFVGDNFGTDGLADGGALLTKRNLELTQPSSPGSMWIDAFLASQELNPAQLESPSLLAATLEADNSDKRHTPMLANTAVHNEWNEVVKAVLAMKEAKGIQHGHRRATTSDIAEPSEESYMKALENPVTFINQPDDQQQTPLLFASRYGDQKIVELLLNTGHVNIEAQDEDGHTPSPGQRREGMKPWLSSYWTRVLASTSTIASFRHRCHWPRRVEEKPWSGYY